MAILFISEYSKASIDNQGRGVMAGKEPAVVTQIVAIGAGSVASAAFSSATKFVRLHTDTACNFAFGIAPTAVADTSPRMAANQTEFFGIPPGYKVAVIAASA